MYGIVVLAALIGAAGCNTVERTFTGKPLVERPVEVEYRFENVKRTPTVNEWDSIRRILYLHAKGSVSVADANQRKYDQTDLRDYTARFTVSDLSQVTKINEEIDALAGEKVAGEKLRFAMSHAAVTFAGDNLEAMNDTILRGVTLPAATVRVFPKSGMQETMSDQYGAWAKRVSVTAGESDVYGYAEGLPINGQPGTKRYFRINVFTMSMDPVSEGQFNAATKR
jgi:hypothetical protein